MKPRRSLLRGLVALAATMTLRASWGQAIARPLDAFRTRRYRKALRALYGDRVATRSAAVRIETVDLAEDGSVVPVRVTATVPTARGIALLAPSNPTPLIALFELAPALAPIVATRIKLAQSGELVAIVETEGALLKASAYIRVTHGGCA